LIEIEMFAHGALCMAISGKCYLSLHSMNSSANRGSCLQNCRRSYIVTEKETGNELEIDNEYIMSPKDLKTIHFMDRMIDAGVRVFKIEGRARSADYVKTVCLCYSEAAQAVVDGSFNQQKIDDWDSRLSKVFNRGFWDGYYLGQKMGEWSQNYGNLASEKKIYIGKALNFFPQLGIGEFLMETKDLHVGEKVMVMGPTTGVYEFEVPEIRVELKPVDVACKGEKFSMPVPAKIRRSDKLYKVVESERVKDNQ
jgi:collagenase. Unknown type peptidase. MEROPS family U32